MNELKLIGIFCKSDDFCPKLEKFTHHRWLAAHMPASRLTLSEMRTLCMAFHLSGYKTFKQSYYELVLAHWQPYFPHLVCYEYFVSLQKQTIFPLYTFLWSECRGERQGLSFIDSCKVALSDNRRIFSHKVFDPIAARGKTAGDWLFGFKRHLTIKRRTARLCFISRE